MEVVDEGEGMTLAVRGGIIGQPATPLETVYRACRLGKAHRRAARPCLRQTRSAPLQVDEPSPRAAGRGEPTAAPESIWESVSSLSPPPGRPCRSVRHAPCARTIGLPYPYPLRPWWLRRHGPYAARLQNKKAKRGINCVPKRKLGGARRGVGWG